MKKKVISGVLAVLLALTMSLPAFADTHEGGADWKVAFTTDKKMESTFKSSELNDVINNMQPGDEALFEVSLKNENDAVTDWYMKNNVIKSLEDRTRNEATKGGAYDYELIYYNNAGQEKVLFSSDTVGGDTVSEAGEGLNEATNALKEYFFLDTLNKGEGGRVTLRVKLDGETQGNVYQDTLADLDLQFAVELPTTTPTETTPTEPTNPTTPTQPTQPTKPRTPNYVRTGDETNITPFVILAAGLGTMLIVLSIVSVATKKRKEEER